MGFGFRDWALGSGRLCPTIRSPQCVFFVFRDAAPRKCGGFREFLSPARFGFCEIYSFVASSRVGCGWLLRALGVGFKSWLVSGKGLRERFPQVYRALLTVYARATSRVDRKRAPRRSGHQAGASRRRAESERAARQRANRIVSAPPFSRVERARTASAHGSRVESRLMFSRPVRP